MLNRLLSIRISVMTWILLGIFIIYVFIAHPTKLTPGQLALFSVNSFLFGYYFAPLLNSQKSRVASLILAARQEEMVLLDILTQSHLLTKTVRHQLKIRLAVYLRNLIGNKAISADNIYYNELLYYVKSIEGKDESVMNIIYYRVSKTMSNRDVMNNLFASKIYSHEWLVALALFSITLYFAMQTDVNGSVFFGVILAILCTGLSLLMIILVKFATLTHKEAKRMWVPLKVLMTDHFDDIDETEIIAEQKRIDVYNKKQKAAA
jgi:hypothetical protein